MISNVFFIFCFLSRFKRFSRPYLTITQDDRLTSADNKKEQVASDGDKYIPTAAENVNVVKKANDEDKYSSEDLEIQSRAASGRAVTPANKSLSM